MNINYEDFNYYVVNEENFKLNQGDEAYIKNRLNYIQELTPVYSSMILNLSKRKDVFKGQLKINSFNCSFFSNGRNIDPLILFQELEEEILEQVKSWKQKRFLNITKVDSIQTSVVSESA